MTIELYSIDELNAIGDAAIRTNLPELDPSLPGSWVFGANIHSRTHCFFEQIRRLSHRKDEFHCGASREGNT